MPQQLDVYKDWLRIEDADRPLNNYQLLRLKKFEDDPGKIREHYRKLNAHVRKYSSGDFAQQSQDLLNELAKAMLCLTDAQRKAEYDATLGRKQKSQDGKRRSLEEILLASKAVDPEKVQKARTYANAVGVEIRDAFIQQKIAPADVVMPAYAESIGLPYLDLADVEIDPLLVARVPANVARQQSLAPVMIDDGQLLLAAPHLIDPDVLDDLRLRIGLPVRTVLCTPAAIHGVVEKFFTKEAAAAEIAKGNTAQPKAAAKAGKAAAADKPRTANDVAELKAERFKLALVTFNFSFMVVMVALWLLTDVGFFMRLMIAVLAGAIGAGAAWVVKSKGV